MSTCRSCGRPIRWARTTKAKRIPIDLAPVDDGNVTLSDDRDPIATVHPPGQAPLDAGPRYVSHFATCPDADRHRKR